MACRTTVLAYWVDAPNLGSAGPARSTEPRPRRKPCAFEGRYAPLRPKRARKKEAAVNTFFTELPVVVAQAQVPKAPPGADPAGPKRPSGARIWRLQHPVGPRHLAFPPNGNAGANSQSSSGVKRRGRHACRPASFQRDFLLQLSRHLVVGVLAERIPACAARNSSLAD